VTTRASLPSSPPLPPVLVVSPHLDDAVFSCGQLLAARPGSVVVTVCTGLPGVDQPHTEWDTESGFSSAREAVGARRTEDARAMELVGASRVGLDLLDGQYVLPTDHEERMQRALDDAIGDRPSLALFVPLGIRHPDHQLVGRLARDVARAQARPAILYEELPYRVEEPDEHLAALDRVHDEGWLLEHCDLALGPLEVKDAAIDCYVSQARLFERTHLMAEERYLSARAAPLT
jgi:LmbE family N-acetylglucosaminyl deacetylase